MAMGAFRTAGDLGLLLGPPVLGAIADSVGFSTAFVINAAIVAASALTLMAVVRFGAQLSPHRAEGSIS
jgi:MFS family permease